MKIERARRNRIALAGAALSLVAACFAPDKLAVHCGDGVTFCPQGTQCLPGGGCSVSPSGSDGGNGGCGAGSCLVGTVCMPNNTITACGVPCSTCTAPAGATATCSSSGACHFACDNTCPVGSGCADLTSDVNNCGKCGTKCAEGTCVGGKCQPVLIASPKSPTDIAVSKGDGAVYWTDSLPSKMGSIQRQPPMGAPGQFVGGLDAPVSVAVDGNAVYWTETGAVPGTGRVVRVPLPAGSATPLASGQFNPYDILVSNDYVYWSALGVGGPNGGVYRVQRNTAGAPDVIGPGLDRPHGVTVDASAAFAFWCAPASGDIFRAAAGGNGTPTKWASPGGHPERIVLSNNALFWTQNDFSGSIQKYDLNTDNPSTLATGQSFAYGLTVDEQTPASIYWTNHGSGSAADGSVMRLHLVDGATPETLATNQAGPTAIALADKFVYWVNTNSGQGAVMRLGK